MKKVDICTSGKARPMPSPSTTGSPARAAVSIGSIEFEPPISAEMMAAHLTPAASSTPRKRAQTFVALLDFLDADDRRADAADRADECVVVERFERDHADGRALAHQLAQAQHADVGIAAAARAEQRGAERERQQVALDDRGSPHAASRSPTTFTCTRVALPGR